MTIDQWTAVATQVVAHFSSPLSPDEQAILRSEFVEGDLSHLKIFKRVGQPMFREILARGRDGQTFGDPARLHDDVLNGSVESIYAGASPTFLNLTRSFLTFWREYLDVAHTKPQSVLQWTLSEVIGNYKKVFFPAFNIRTAAPYMLFASEQRRILTVIGDGIDVEDFFRSNPLLERTTNPLRGSGCLVVVLFAGTFVCLCILLWSLIP